MTLLVWFGIIIIVAAGVGLLVLQQRGTLSAGHTQKELPSLKRNIFNMQIGDIVQHMGIDWVVEGKLTYAVDKYTWFEYMLQDGDEIRWLLVDEDDTVEVALLETNNQLDVSQTPPRQLNFAGDNYQCVDSGVASMTRVGTIQRRAAAHCEYYDYQGSGNNVLSIEVWDGETEVTIGQRINPRTLTILPGDGTRVYGV